MSDIRKNALGTLDGRRQPLIITLGVLAFAGLALHVLHASLGFGGDSLDAAFNVWIYNGVLLISALICLTRAAFVARERAPWLLFGVAAAAYAVGFLTYEFLVSRKQSVPYPSMSDGFWLAFYPLVYVALVLLLRKRVTQFHRSLWLDGFIAACALASVVTAIVFEPILAATDHGGAAVATALAYPVGDIVLLGFVCMLFAVTGWRPATDLLVLVLALLVQVVAHLVYLYEVAKGGWTPGTTLDDAWLLVTILLGAVGWLSVPSTRPRQFEGPGLFAMPLIFTALSISVLVYAGLANVSPVAVCFAGASILLAVGRLALTLRESRTLALLASRDGLTGLLNHRQFHVALSREIAAAEQDGGELAVVLFDLDRFKRLNDTHGHAEGDRILRSAAAAMQGVCRTSDHACRVGGDELALVLPGAGHAAALAIAERVRAGFRAIEAGIDTSFGISTWPEDGPAKDMVLLRADIALYAAKNPNRSSASTAGNEDDPARERERAQLQAYAHDLRLTYVRELRKRRELQENYLATVRALAAAVEAKDDFTGGHINRVHRLGLVLARSVVPDEIDDPQLPYGFLLHDVGKLAVPDAVLTKPGRLTDEEWVLMRRHPEVGAQILSNVPFLDRALDIVLHHHERWDGRGYPDGLAGDDIPLWARIFAVVDTVDAITSDRPYRPASPLKIAVAEVLAGAGTQFDPACAHAFAALDPDEVEQLLEHRPSIGLVSAEPRGGTSR